MTLDEIKESLQTRHQTATLSRDDVPTSKGLYVWSGARAEDVLYVGRALGKNGLRGRIWKQHLNPKQLESREKLFQPADDFQRGCNVMRKGKVCVDQSVFRRNLGSFLRLGPGEETVRYIREHLAVAWAIFSPDQDGEICIYEDELIRELKPRFNKRGRR